jgi:uncharacterized membrane protein
LIKKEWKDKLTENSGSIPFTVLCWAYIFEMAYAFAGMISDGVNFEKDMFFGVFLFITGISILLVIYLKPKDRKKYYRYCIWLGIVAFLSVILCAYVSQPYGAAASFLSTLVLVIGVTMIIGSYFVYR